MIDSVFGPWVEQSSELATAFRSAAPFPLVVIDGFCRPEVAESLVAEFPGSAEMRRSHDYIFGDKRESADLVSPGETSQRLREALLSSEFAGVLSRIASRNLFVDPAFHGGGFHHGSDGSYLDTHVDFNLHPDHPDWLRVLNVLLYLNPDWKPEYGGDLLVRRNPNDDPRAIAPLFNRGVIMLTADFTYHGYRQMSLPADVSRKSIACYAYEVIPAGSVAPRTTAWKPENAGPIKRFLAERWTTLARIRRRVSR
jgi:hypothetical protein